MNTPEVLEALDHIRHNALRVGKGTELVYAINDLIDRLKAEPEEKVLAEERGPVNRKMASR